MKTFTIEDIRSWVPCYDPNKHLPQDWNGTIIDILKHETIPSQDKLWVVCREELISAKILRLFAVWCVRQVEHLMTDERSKKALNVAERYAHGNATNEELVDARAAARAAARADAWYAAWAAAGAAGAAARADAGGAARYAARAAARAAAGDTQVSQLIKMVETE